MKINNKPTFATKSGNIKTQSLICLLLVVTFVLCSMYSGWELGGESWGYWYFARVFSETGQFIVTDRSPLYILYLNLFSKFSYPQSIITEYLVTTIGTVLALIYFLRLKLGVCLSIFAACLWIPYLQSAEPPVQKLALMASLIAISIRVRFGGRATATYFYFLLCVAALFRQTYLLLLLTFVGYDLINNTRRSVISSLPNWTLLMKKCWPLIFLLGIYIWFKACQSISPWNTVWFTDSQWFPADGKTMGSGAIQAFNMAYTLRTYGTYVGHDFFLTNKEAFDGANSMLSAFSSNPKLIIDILWVNFKALIPTLAMGNWIPRTGLKFVDYLMTCLFVLVTLVGALKANPSSVNRIFLLGSLALAASSVVAHPSVRYMMPLIPVFILAASWYGVKIASAFKVVSSDIDNKLFKNTYALIFFAIVSILIILIFSDYIKIAILIAILIFCSSLYFYLFRIDKNISTTYFCQFLLIVMFSNTQLAAWDQILQNMSDSISKGQLAPLQESSRYSITRAQPELNHLLQKCGGVMAYESLFLGAFTNTPLDRIYTPWEIPPFGNLGDSTYEGLNSKRIDCLLISLSLKTAIGGGTNIQLRYQSYIKPYAEQLRQLGAETHVIPHFGELLTLPNGPD